MSHKNYTRYSKINEEESVVNEDSIIESEESAVIEQPIEVLEYIPEVEPEVEVSEEIELVVEAESSVPVEPTKIGKVFGCKKLNVRDLPSKASNIVTEIFEGVELMIDEKGSTALFYKVCTEHGIEGYCMKEFIKVLS